MPSRGEVLLWLLAPSAGIAAAVGGYAWLALGAAGFHAYRVVLAEYLAGATLLTTLLNAPLAALILRPLVQIRAALAAKTPLASLPAPIFRRALTFHIPLAAIVLAGWIAGSVAWLPIAYYGVGSPQVVDTAHLVVIGGMLLGFMAAAADFYFLHMLIGTRVGPVLLAGGSLGPLGRIRLVRVWHHLALILVTLGVIQPLAAAVMLKMGLVEPRHLAYLAVLMLAIGGLQSYGVVRAVAGPAGHLASRMALVREGHLDVSAEVMHLDTLGQLCSDFNAMVEGLRQRERIRETFGRYVSRQVADAVLAGEVEVDGEVREVTILFSDLRGFTAMSEGVSPREVLRFLNGYLDTMVESVFAHGGTPDKFVGDAVMAVFGAPVSRGTSEEARAAMACALDMRRRLARINQLRAARGLPPVEMGIGIHTGEVVAGNLGSQRFMEYTVIGDAVNLASRIESTTKELGVPVLVSEATAAHAGDDLEVRPVETVRVKGRAAAVRVHTLVGVDPSDDPRSAG